MKIHSDVPVKQPNQLKPGECLIRMHCTGVCHTDLHAARGDWPVPTKTPLIGGHEGVGDIVAIGENTVDSPVKLGDRVGIKWIAYSCVSSDYRSSHVIYCPLVSGVSSVNSAETLMSKVSIRVSYCPISLLIQLALRLRKSSNKRLYRRWNFPTICRKVKFVHQYS